MIVGVDHVVILVHDLRAAQEHYKELGFTVVPGGEHTDGATHNALVPFADGSYLELLAFRRDTPEHRWWRHVAHGEGLIDWALLPDAIAADVAYALQHGADFDDPVPGGRLRPDGREIAWETAWPRTPDLPFLCGDVTPRVLRVPNETARQHANGVVGIAGVTVAVEHLASSLARYQALVALSADQASSPIQPGKQHDLALSEPDAQHATLPIGLVMVTLAQPAASSPTDDPALPLRTHLATRGEGPFALSLRVANSPAVAKFDPALTHSVSISAVPA